MAILATKEWVRAFRVGELQTGAVPNQLLVDQFLAQGAENPVERVANDVAESARPKIPPAAWLWTAWRPLCVRIQGGL